MDLRSGQTVLDVAAGNGNATLAAARRWCDVSSTDYIPALLERGRLRAEAEQLEVTFAPADAENLPFADASFDAVISTFGAMFTLRAGGKIGLANWTPDGFIGEVFKALGGHLPPPAELKSPALWGTEDRLTALFPPCRCSRRRARFRVPVPVTAPLAGDFPHLVRPRTEGVRRIGCGCAG